MCVEVEIPYSGKISREKTFVVNVAVLYLSVKVFSDCLKARWRVGGTSDQSTIVLSAKSHFLYGIIIIMVLTFLRGHIHVYYFLN